MSGFKLPQRIVLPAAAMLLALAMGAAYGYAQVGGGFDLSWSTVDGGGGTFSTGGSLSLGGTIGQSDAGRASGGAFTADGGFWGGAGGATATPTSTITPTRTNTATRTRTATRTNTPLPTQTPGGPTATSIPTNTRTNTPTRTETPTRTHTPTRTRTPLPTQTPGGPSATPIPTDTPTNTPTLTNTPTRTNTPLPTQTPGGPPATPIPTDTPTGVSSPPPSATGTTPEPTSTACPIQFSDVPNPSTFYAFIRCLACRGIVNGYSDGTFRPNNNVTRGQLSKIVSNSAGFSDPQTVQMFEDVPPGSTFFDYIGRLASRGYINGYPCGGTGEPCNPPANLPYFRTNNNATRGQITKIVSNAAGFVDPPAGQIFEDVPPGSTFYTYTQRLASRSIMQGYPCGGSGEPCQPPSNLPYFRPNNNATRGQTSKIVSNTFFPSCQTPDRR